VNERSRRPTAATIVPRLLDAVERLFAKKPPSGVTMRAIAKEAGLGVGVAYRYFDTREALIGAALERIGERIAEAAATEDDPARVLAALWQVLADNPAFPRLVTSLTLDGRTVSEVMSRHPLARDVADRAAERGLEQPTLVATITLFLAIGGSVFGPTVNRAAGRDSKDRAFYDALSEMFALWLDKQSAEAAED
jgi:AcrR family transcriptional regulator